MNGIYEGVNTHRQEDNQHTSVDGRQPLLFVFDWHLRVEEIAKPTAQKIRNQIGGVKPTQSGKKLYKFKSNRRKGNDRKVFFVSLKNIHR